MSHEEEPSSLPSVEEPTVEAYPVLVEDPIAEAPSAPEELSRSDFATSEEPPYEFPSSSASSSSASSSSASASSSSSASASSSSSSSSDAASGKLVLVTGGTGFIAGHVIEQLAKRGGYRVRTTVRSLAKKDFYEYLYALCPGLEVFEADLNVPNSFHEAAKGCEIIFHIASPFFLATKNPQQDLVDPAVNGVKNVFQAARDAGSVKRIVMTSSVAAIYGYPDDKPDGAKFTEDDWNATSTLQHSPYYVSKLKAEQTAWQFIENLPAEEKFSLVTINPSLVTGPIHSSRCGTSVDVIKDALAGKVPGCPKIGFGLVDVRDVAIAHILAAENPEANGRYICDAKSMWFLEMCQVLAPEFPTKKVPTKPLWNWLAYVGALFNAKLKWNDLDHSLEKIPLFDNSRIKRDLGMTFRSIEQSLIDTGKSLEHFKLI